MEVVVGVLKNQRMERPPNRYLIRAQQLGIVPNFFMSDAYLAIANAEMMERNGWMWMEEGGEIILPPIPSPLTFPDTMKLPEGKVWAGFENTYNLIFYSHFYDNMLLDYQYIFNPESFQSMEGGMWETFRKNSRKWSKRNGPGEYISESELNQPNLTQLYPLLGEWLEYRMETVQDAEILAEFAVFSKHPGITRRFLRVDGRIVGVNAWDENYKYINYRICITKAGEPFLNEYMRLLFYTDSEILKRGKLVNDGGHIGIPGLEKFKDKMNPVLKKPIYSLIKKTIPNETY